MVNYTQFLNCTVGNASLEYSHCLADVPAYENCPDPSICEEQSSDEHLGLAFGLTIGAGLATTLGALLPFVPFIKQRNTQFLAAAMALAAGVMLYVSFTDIRTKSLNSFCCVSPAHFDVLTTSCFFGGILLTALLDLLVWSLQKLDCGCGTGRLIVKRVKFSTAKETLDVGEGETQQHRQGGGGGEEQISIEEGCRRRGTTRGKVRLQAVNGCEFDTDSLDANTLILPPHDSRNGSTESSSSNSTTPTAQSLEEGCDAALEAEGAEVKEVAVWEAVVVGTEMEVKTIAPAEDENSSVQHSQTLTASDGVSISLVSNTMSENTNNIATASINELFSNSSLLRMNAVIPESASVCTSAVVGEKGVKVVGDSASRVCVEPADPDDDSGVVVQATRKGRGRRNSYQEMTDDDFVPLGPEEFRDLTEVVSPDKKSLKRMGALTGLAIGLHNVPEGLATFVATLASPAFGGALALAIALHNIPEGVCVAMPVYYATGSRVRGFLWAFLSGISEPLGALLGWLILRDVLGPLVYGVSFGAIAGMMVYISLKELLPTALRFDKKSGLIVPIFLGLGMVVMAISLSLILY